MGPVQCWIRDLVVERRHVILSFSTFGAGLSQSLLRPKLLGHLAQSLVLLLLHTAYFFARRQTELFALKLVGLVSGNSRAPVPFKVFVSDGANCASATCCTCGVLRM